MSEKLSNKFNNQITIINDDVLKIDETKLFNDKVIVLVIYIIFQHKYLVNG